MRLITKIKQPDSEVKRLTIFDSDEGVFLFGFDTENDASAIWDNWFLKVEHAFEASEAYGVEKADWIEIPDPLEDCLHDRIQPVRIRGLDKGKPDRGNMEKLVDGKWVKFEHDEE